MQRSSFGWMGLVAMALVAGMCIGSWFPVGSVDASTAPVAVAVQSVGLAQAPIDDAEVIAYSDDYARRYADAGETFYGESKRFYLRWWALGMSGKISDDATEIADTSGASGDGRPQATCEKLYDLYALAEAIVTDYEAGGNAKLQQFISMSVNGEI